jgi:hypothetical protein
MVRKVSPVNGQTDRLASLYTCSAAAVLCQIEKAFIIIKPSCGARSKQSNRLLMLKRKNRSVIVGRVAMDEWGSIGASLFTTSYKNKNCKLNFFFTHLF